MILISGCTGFVGQELVKLFKKRALVIKKLKLKILKIKKNFF